MNPLIVVISILRGGNENIPSVISPVGRVFGRWGQYGFIWTLIENQGLFTL
jgi:hypothetical protein